jgi:hypothetical protein
VPVTYHIFPSGDGWRVHSRGFVWDFATGEHAVEFANDMAEQFARATGQPASVRFQEAGGDFHELRAYEGAGSWLPGAQEGAARQATVVPLRRKGH